MKKILILAVCLFGFLTGYAQKPSVQEAASPEYQKELSEVLELQHLGTMSTETLQSGMGQLVKQGLVSQENLDAMVKELSDVLTPKIEKQVRELWSANFTLKELKEIKKWITSPVGKKMLEMTPEATKISQEMMQSPEMQQQIISIVSKYVKM